MSHGTLTEHMVRSTNGTQIQTWLLESSRTPHSTRIAFIGHPLGRLGGSWRDPTVQAVGALCSRLDYDVCFISSRGRGKSGGWASFSQIPEAEDYQSVIDVYTSQRQIEEALLIGYSAGALSVVWSRPQILQTPSIKIRRILISYPLSAMWALTVWRSSPFTSRLQELAASSKEKSLIIYGDCDEFTGIGAYRAWREELEAKGSAISGWARIAKIKCSRSKPTSQTAFQTVENANHFWFNSDDRQRLIGHIEAWLMHTS